MAKMFYSSEEAAAKLNVPPDDLKQFVADNRLREFRDGSRVMFKVDQVDRLSSEAKTGSSVIGLQPPAGDSGIDLAVGDSGKHDSVSLADTDVSRPAPAKDDTVVTGQGVNVLEAHPAKPADANAQTQISSPIDEGISPSSLEGVGSGSGLLDLTRESDDTSLGAELLDEIYPGKDKAGIGSSSGVFEQSTAGPADLSSGPSGLENMSATPAMPMVAATVVEAPDPTAGAFGGMALAAVLAMALATIVAACAFEGFSPSWVRTLSGNWIILAVGLVVLTLLLAGAGFFAGKASTR